MNLKGKVVIVTGAGKGIGRCIANVYGSHGARVIIAEKDPDAGREIEKSIVSAGGDAIFKLTDITHPEDIRQLVSTASELYGTIDILINNAGISRQKSPYDLSVEEWDDVINTNLRGLFLCSREAARIMKEHGGGSIVNISSTRAFMSEPDSEAYAASKGGILALTHAMAASLSPDHIRVNCISPGWIETGDYNKLRETDHSQHPSGRVGKPEDIAKACLYLTDEENGFVTGTNIIVDGGMTRKMIYEE
jgi:NAD(P)-dependent dehydrogenase (short-subunit alcohol dehydrogenase family)